MYNNFMNDFKYKALIALKRIPYGKVTTYGDIALYLGNVKLARAIGNILHRNVDPDFYPCYKVVNRDGRVAKHYAFGGIDGQKGKLMKEGIAVVDDKVDLNIYRYKFDK
jgi:O-6-methylguanine DNA methyltransferase